MSDAQIKLNKMNKIIDSGRFICKDSFLDKNPNEKLRSDCTDVIQYCNGMYIQVLKTGLFHVDENFSSHSLDESEAFMLKINNK